MLFPDVTELRHANIASTVSALLAPGGLAVLVGKLDRKCIEDAGLQTLSVPIQGIPEIILAKRHGASNQAPVSTKHPASTSGPLLVVADPLHSLNAKLSQTFHARIIRFEDLDVVEIPEKSTVIVTAELDKPILSTASPQQLAAVQKVTDNASNLLWITGGNLIETETPDLSLVFGLSRTVMAEQPALKFFVVDIDDPKSNVDLSVSNLLSILENASEQTTDYEYLQRGGLLHISRFLADSEANQQFAEKKVAEAKDVPLRDANCSRLSIGTSGQLGTLHFVPVSRLESLPEDHIEIQVRATGINAKVGFQTRLSP